MKTKITTLLGIESPVVQGGMAWVAESHLAAAVSNAGGLGIIGAASAPAEWVRAQIQEVKRRTDKPFGVNIMLISPYAKEVAELVAEEKVPVVTTGAGSPEKYMSLWKEAGIKVIPVVASVALAKRMERCGADALVAEGTEAGGHIGENTTMVLVPQVVDAVNVPVIAAGGIADGRGMAAAFMLGAEGVQIGTRFVASREAQVHENYKNCIIKARDIDSRVTGRSTGHPVRALRNQMTKIYLEKEQAGVPFEELELLTLGGLRKAVVDGDVTNGSVMAGQSAAMVKDFYEHSEIARNIIDRSSGLLKLDMKSLCFEENENLHQTEYTQAALVTVCMAMEQVLREAGVKPDVTAGLSLGEYCAIASAGGMQIEDAILAVRKRGILMQNAVPDGKGAMAAVLGLDAEKIEAAIAGIEGVSIANYNCPGQIVITGWKESVEQAGAVLKDAGAKRVLPLNVSGPFHSPMLQEAAGQLKEVLDQIECSPLQIPYVTNVTGRYVSDIEETKELLIQQIAAPVRWQQSVEEMIRQGVDTFVEIGPGRTLSGFLRKINRDVKVYQVSTWEDIEKAGKELC